VIAQRAIPNSVRGRVSALMMVLSQGAMTLGAIIWGLTAELVGTRLTLLTAAFLFLVAAVLGSMLLSRIFRNSDIIEDKAPSLSA
jgi:MFS family permease